MTALTRRRYPERHNCWHIYFGDVQVGAIVERVGQPHDEDVWEWNCGFYPGSKPGECTVGTAASFEKARANFEGAWAVYSANRREADYQAWRDQRAHTEWKYAMWDRGCKLPTQLASGRSKCFCGAEIEIGTVERHIREAHAA